MPPLAKPCAGGMCVCAFAEYIWLFCGLRMTYGVCAETPYDIWSLCRLAICWRAQQGRGLPPMHGPGAAGVDGSAQTSPKHGRWRWGGGCQNTLFPTTFYIIQPSLIESFIFFGKAATARRRERGRERERERERECVCVCVCACACVLCVWKSIYICKYMYKYIYIYTYISTCISISIYLYIFIHIYTYTHTSISTYIYISIRIRLAICRLMCMYLYMNVIVAIWIVHITMVA